jgi:pantothenate synthetase
MMKKVTHQPTTDAKTLLAKTRHILSNELDYLLSKSSRNVPLENDEIKKLKVVTEILTASLAEEREQIKAEQAVDPAINQTLVLQGVATEDILKLLRKPD